MKTYQSFNFTQNLTHHLQELKSELSVNYSNIVFPKIVHSLFQVTQCQITSGKFCTKAGKTISLIAGLRQNISDNKKVWWKLSFNLYQNTFYFSKISHLLRCCVWSVSLPKLLDFQIYFTNRAFLYFWKNKSIYE